jgi:hypothetical protein
MTRVRTLTSVCRDPKANIRAGETHIGGDTVRGGEDSFLAERGRLLLLLLLVISVPVILQQQQHW